MTTQRLLARAVAAVLACAALFAVAVPVRAQGDRTVRVGVLVALSGQGSQIGQWIFAGAETAAARLAATGGPKIQIIGEDTQWLPQKGIEGFNKLVNINKADVLVAGGSAVMEALAPLADERKIVLLNAGAQSPRMAGIGKFTFSVLQLSDFDTGVLTKYAYNTLKYHRIGTLYVNNDTGKFNQAAFAEFFKGVGGTITAQEAFKPSETNFGVQIAKLRATNPDAVYVVGLPVELPFAVKQIRQLAPKMPILSYAGIESREFIAAAGDAGNGVVYTTTAFDPDRSDPAVAAFVAAYQAKYKEKPTSPYIGYGYDAVMIIGETLKATRGEAGEAMRARIHQIKRFGGVTGDNDFRPDGTVAKSVAVRRIEGGTFKTITVVQP